MKKGGEKAREKQETTTITMEPLSPVSQLFVLPGLYCVIVFTLGFQTRCNPSAILEGIKNTWLKLPRFSSKVVMDDKKGGDAFWVPVTVRVEDHVVVPDLDHSNIQNPDEFIQDYTSNLANSPMDMSRPLWEFHLLNIKTSNAESLCIGKLHHSLGDGMSLMSLLLASSKKTSDSNAIPRRKHVKDSNHDKGLCWLLVARFWLIVRVIFTTVTEISKFLLILCFMRDTKTSLKRKFGDEVQPRKVMHRIISFDDVKFVKNTMNMKVNDVLLGMTQAGLSRYLSKKYDSKDEKKRILEKICLRGIIVINLRPDTKIEDISDMMAKGSKCRWGNSLSTVVFPLWIRYENDPLEYIQRSKATMDMKKISMEPLIVNRITKLTMKIFGRKITEAIIKRVFDHTTLTYSNVMGPHEEISFFDHPMSYVGASALLGNQALIIHLVSYVNKITINLTVDTTVIPDPHLLLDDLVESLDVIKLAILEKNIHKVEIV